MFLFLLVNSLLYSQSFFDNSIELNKKRMLTVSSAHALLWGGSIGTLYNVWYKNFPKTSFHFFDDSNEWQQMDKLGHIATSYQLTRTTTDLYKWTGLKPKTSALIGGTFSFSYLLSFEILDAYNKNWGFSWSDIGANTSGILLYSVQDFFWNKQFVRPKFSYHASKLAQYRPQLLGGNKIESLLKDYNGQTYWLSFNPVGIINSTLKFPKWLNISIGYSINNQLIGDGGTFVVSNEAEQLSFTPYRQFYLSLDIDWEQIPVKSKVLKLVFRGLNMIKLPFPAIEFSNSGVKGHGVYF